MDVEAAVARSLMEAVGAKAYLEKPENPPDEYIVVELTGGGAGILDEVSVDIDCYAPKRQRKQAKALADAVALACRGLDELASLSYPDVTNVYRQNDPDTGEARYVVQLKVWVNL